MRLCLRESSDKKERNPTLPPLPPAWPPPACRPPSCPARLFHSAFSLSSWIALCPAHPACSRPAPYWLIPSSTHCSPGEAATAPYIQSQCRGEEQPQRLAPSPIPPQRLTLKAKASLLIISNSQSHLLLLKM